MLNSDSLRASGRSTAVDFWHHREARLCGNRNYFHMYWRTDSPGSTAVDGMTEFWVMQARKTGNPGVAPAAAVINKDVGEAVVKLICSEGSDLDKMMEATGLAADGQLDVARLEYLFQDHCAVMRGHLPNSSWPRHRRRGGETVPSLVCSCCTFMMHGECEHVLFVRALLGDPVVNLKAVPVLRKRGRKRKQGSLDSLAKTAAKAKKLQKVLKAPRKK